MTGIKIYHAFNILWCFICGWETINDSTWTVLSWFLWLAYVGLFAGLMADSLWCLRALLLPPLTIFTVSAPFIMYNDWAFLMGDPRYLDSPGTILIVAICAVFTTIPAAFALSCYWRIGTTRPPAE